MRVLLTEDADADLLQIHTYIAERNPAAALSLAHEFEQKFVSLSRFPFIGRERPSLSKNIRSVVAGNYVIFYRIESDRVTIVRILHGRRDIDVEFQQ
jgi:toxin ParE1/3/4